MSIELWIKGHAAYDTANKTDIIFVTDLSRINPGSPVLFMESQKEHSAWFSQESEKRERIEGWFEVGRWRLRPSDTSAMLAVEGRA